MSQGSEYAFPASFAQRRLWSVEQTEATGGAYNVSCGLRFNGELHIDRLAAAFNYLDDRHEILRTTLAIEAGELRQVVRPPGSLLLRLERLEGGIVSAESALRLRLEAEAAAPFDLAAGPLLRATLFRLGARDHALEITMHHSIVDAWSIDILVKELAAAYNAGPEQPALAPLPIQYADFSVWQIEAQSGEGMAGKLRYWQQELAGPLPTLELPIDHPPSPTQTYEGSRISLEIGPEISKPIRRLARETNATVFMALLASFQVFLYRHTGQTDVIVGTPVTGRTRRETADLIGFFLNMLAIRVDFTGDPKFREIIAQVRDKVLGALDAQEVPFEHLVDVLQVRRDLSRHPIFQAVFVYQLAPEPVPVFSGATVERLPSVPSRTSKFDLMLSITDDGHGLAAEFEYNTGLFDAETVRRMAERYLVLLRGIVAAADEGSAPVSLLPLLPPDERSDLLDRWNQTTTDYPRDATMVALFEQQADLAPDSVAVIVPRIGTPQRITYRELDERANRLARHLQDEGLAPGSAAGILLDRSAEFVVAILATLKAGCTYVPLDPSLPAERVRRMLEEANAALLVTTSRIAAKLPRGATPAVYLDGAGTGRGGEAAGRPALIHNPDVPAYIMYTSGSTGQPKGVAIPHRAIIRLVRNTNYVSLSSTDVILACAPMAFDASTFEIWGSLLNGGQLVLFPDDVPHPNDIGRLIAEYGVTTLWLTAGLFHLMAETNARGFAGLRQLLAGGDVLSPSLVRKALQHLPKGVLINGYGPTENTTFTCCHRMTDAGEVGETVAIGPPNAHTRVYKLDARMEVVPGGGRGELWTAGDGLATGYRNDAELSAARFRQNPFDSDPKARIYCTGDIARYRQDGVIEFFGRKDTQIKIRGFRIEPGEVERTICLYAGVADAVAIARERGAGNKVLLAYMVPAQGATIEIGEMRSFLRQRLPEYAVPSGFMCLPAFPLTPHGKVDHAALPDPVVHRGPVVGLPDALETQILVIWEQALGITGIGVDDNFFDLGGNSLRAITMLSSVERALGRPVPVAALYRGQTVATMAVALRDDSVDPSRQAIAIQPGGTRPILFVVPGVNGDVIGYEALARALGPDQPLYGLRSVGLDGEHPPLETVTEIAAWLLAEVERVQPRGPYRLAGFCMGGIVAYEIAQQLAARGEQTELLGLIDTWAPEVIQAKRRRTRYGTQLAFLARGVSRHLRAMWIQPRGERLGYLLRSSRILGQMVKQRDVYRGDSRVLHHEMVTHANQRAAAGYRPAPYDGGMLLVLSNEVERRPDEDARLSWQKLARDECTVIRVSGKDSGALLRTPHVTHLAAALERQLAPTGGQG